MKDSDIPERNSEQPEAPTEPFDKYLKYEEIRQLVLKIPELLKTHMDARNELLRAQLDAQVSTTKRATIWILLWSAILAIIIVVPVTTLVWHDKLSSDAAAFLFGAVVGAAFTFLRTFFPSAS